MQITTGKQRSQRIPLDYYRRADGPLRLKRILSVAALTGAVAYGGWVASPSGISQVSPGPLSRAHASLEASACEACHTLNLPIRPTALNGQNVAHVQSNNARCVTCHPAPGHFASATRQEILDQQSCSVCHDEHLGLDHSLTQLADSNCVECHGQIDQVVVADRQGMSPPTYRFAAAIAAGQSHPEFRSLLRDPGTIAFSHAQHLSPGQMPEPDALPLRMNRDRMPEEARDRYLTDAEGFVQLRCDDCHESDAPLNAKPEAGRPLSLRDARGFLPISFERHCAACHTMPLKIPHGLDRTQTEAAVRVAVAAQQVLEDTPASNVGRPPGESDDPSTETRPLDDVVRVRADQALLMLSDAQQCGKCHQLAAADQPSIVAPTSLPGRWLQAGYFAHGDHLNVACQTCHAQAFAPLESRVDSRAESAQVMIGGLSTCAACHQPTDQSLPALPSDEAQGFELRAGGDCVDCHRYHVDWPVSESKLQIPDERLNLQSLRRIDLPGRAD